MEYLTEYSIGSLYVMILGNHRKPGLNAVGSKARLIRGQISVVSEVSLQRIENVWVEGIED